MTEDTRCCGTGTCMINAEGLCWCGQRWNGDEMVGPSAEPSAPADTEEPGLEAPEMQANWPVAPAQN